MVGGAVELTEECKGTIENCTFTGNTAHGSLGKGGALDLDNCLDVSILSGTFENNESTCWGGAIYMDGVKSDFLINTVLFDRNIAMEEGGAIWHCPFGTAHYNTYSGMLMWNNTALDAGSDIFVSKANAGNENGGEYITDTTYTGSDFAWCYDTVASRYDPNSPNLITDSSYYQGSNEIIAMKSNITEAEYLAAKDSAGIIFKGNSSAAGGAIANNGFFEVGHPNGLTIKKEVTGTGAPAGDVFSFTVKFSDGNTYDGVASESTITLKDGEVKLISNIPQGITATVSETPKAHYTTVQALQQAVIGEHGAEFAFVNHYIGPNGSLTVSKAVSGVGADTTKDFPFTVTLSDTTINGTYGDISFVNGVATFSIKHGESKTATGLPAGVTYQVTETAVDKYTAAATGDSGVIADNVTSTASFVNTYGPTGNLTVSKAVSGVGADTTKDFPFTVTLSDTTINGTYGDISFVNGVATFSIKHGERKTATGLPAGVTYQVTETAVDKYTAVATGDSGVIADNVTSTASFVNTYRAVGSLTIVNTVTGDRTDTTKDFTFTVTLSDTTINGTFGGMSFVNGVATFVLKDGESKTATGLPAGVTYTVAETDNDGYTVTKTYDTGAIVADTVTLAVFDNQKVNTGTNNKITLTVQKVWQDQNSANRPASIMVQLYKDGVAFGSPVTLSTNNSWQTKWENLDSGAYWSVDETNVPVGYTKTVSNTAHDWIITNVQSPVTPGNPNVPQTGDTSNIAVWATLLFLSGAALLAFRIKTKSSRGR